MYSLALLSLAAVCSAGAVTYNWEIDWVNGSPAGFSQPVIGINGQWPCPTMEVDVGDTVTVNVKNNLGNETASIHFHGQHQTGTNYADGVPGMTQCAIPHGSSITQTFTAGMSGTHWYHSHVVGQYSDGLRGPMVVHDSSWENGLGVDKQYVISVSDWFDSQMPGLINKLLSPDNSNGAMPQPPHTLLNETNQKPITLDFEAGKKYLVRLMSMASLNAHYVAFDGHKVSVVAVDGVPVQAYEVDGVTIAAGQRIDLVIEALSNPTRDYSFVSQMSDSNQQMNGIISYGGNYSQPQTFSPSSSSSFDDFNLVPSDNEGLYGPVDHYIEMNVSYSMSSQGPRIGLGLEPYVEPKVPTLYTAMTTGSDALNPAVYGDAVAPYILKTGEIVEIIIHNFDQFAHPMHMHGHTYQVVARGSGTFDGNEANFPKTPMKRDTVTTDANGHLVIRFKADNPGIYAFHCHMEWHMAAGMIVTLIESPDVLQQQLQIPQAHYDLCTSQGIPTSGNCAGSTTNLNDTSGCNNEPSSDNWGALSNPPSNPNDYFGSHPTNPDMGMADKNGAQSGPGTSGRKGRARRVQSYRSSPFHA